ncbi:hypothetical protein [Thalassotalea hakodatensis]|uniref:hypothetical protein n=1 Tax=Thalassotalea hakodatensis TaxID=3030492 RepID=UPI00257473D9|nr:hypothetical protein [Thalassotalea hakodatensis]
MKSSTCPHCHRMIKKNTLKELKNTPSILCPYCIKPIRISERHIDFTVYFFSALSGIVGYGIYKWPIAELVIFIAIFSVVYGVFFKSNIGIYFPLEKGEEEDVF